MPLPTVRATALRAALLLAASLPLDHAPAWAGATDLRATPAATPASPTAAEVPADTAATVTTTDQVLVLRRGDTLTGRLAKAGITGGDAHAAAEALATRFRTSQLRPGQRITLRRDPAAPGSLLGLSLEVAPGHTVLVSRGLCNRRGLVPMNVTAASVILPNKAQSVSSHVCLKVEPALRNSATLPRRLHVKPTQSSSCASAASVRTSCLLEPTDRSPLPTPGAGWTTVFHECPPRLKSAPLTG